MRMMLPMVSFSCSTRGRMARPSSGAEPSEREARRASHHLYRNDSAIKRNQGVKVDVGSLKKASSSSLLTHFVSETSFALMSMEGLWERKRM